MAACTSRSPWASSHTSAENAPSNTSIDISYAMAELYALSQGSARLSARRSVAIRYLEPPIARSKD